MSREKIFIKLESFIKEQKRHWKILLKGIVPEKRIVKGWIDSCDFASDDLENIKTESEKSPMMECWLVHPESDKDCEMCPQVEECREIRKEINRLNAENKDLKIQFELKSEPGEFTEKIKRVCDDLIKAQSMVDDESEVWLFLEEIRTHLEFDLLESAPKSKMETVDRIICSKCGHNNPNVLSQYQKSIIEQLQAENKELTKRLQEVCPQFEDITGLLEEKK